MASAYERAAKILRRGGEDAELKANEVLLAAVKDAGVTLKKMKSLFERHEDLLKEKLG